MMKQILLEEGREVNKEHSFTQHQHPEMTDIPISLLILSFTLPPLQRKEPNALHSVWDHPGAAY